jgi:hypothetical protein
VVTDPTQSNSPRCRSSRPRRRRWRRPPGCPAPHTRSPRTRSPPGGSGRRPTSHLHPPVRALDLDPAGERAPTVSLAGVHPLHNHISPAHRFPIPTLTPPAHMKESSSSKNCPSLVFLRSSCQVGKMHHMRGSLPGTGRGSLSGRRSP